MLKFRGHQRAAIVRARLGSVAVAAFVVGLTTSAAGTFEETGSGNGLSFAGGAFRLVTP